MIEGSLAESVAVAPAIVSLTAVGVAVWLLQDRNKRVIERKRRLDLLRHE